MRVRPAIILDASAILALLMEMHRTADINLPPINGAKAISRISRCIQDGAAYVAEDAEGALIGSVGGEIGSDWYSDQPFLVDAWFYVRPAARSSRAAFSLLRSFRAAARDAGLPLRMGVFNGGDVERKDKFFSRAGLRRVGGYFVEGM